MGNSYHKPTTQQHKYSTVIGLFLQKIIKNAHYTAIDKHKARQI